MLVNLKDIRLILKLLLIFDSIANIDSKDSAKNG